MTAMTAVTSTFPFRSTVFLCQLQELEVWMLNVGCEWLLQHYPIPATSRGEELTNLVCLAALKRVLK